MGGQLAVRHRCVPARQRGPARRTGRRLDAHRRQRRDRRPVPGPRRAGRADAHGYRHGDTSRTTGHATSRSESSSRSSARWCSTAPRSTATSWWGPTCGARPDRRAHARDRHRVARARRRRGRQVARDRRARDHATRHPSRCRRSCRTDACRHDGLRSSPWLTACSSATSFAARCAPHPTAWPCWHGDASITFAELDRRGNQVARGARRARCGTHRPGGGVERHHARRAPAVRRGGEARRGVRADQPAARARGGRGDDRRGQADGDRRRRRPCRRRCRGRGEDRRALRSSWPGWGAARTTPTSTEPRLRETDTHVVFFTSGSTGRPKGAVISHRGERPAYASRRAARPKGAMVAPVPAVPHGRVDHGVQQWQAREAMVFATTDPVEHLRRDRAPPGDARPLPARHLAARARPSRHAGRTRASTCRASRFADAATSATPIELLAAIEPRAAERGGARLLRVDRSGSGLVARRPTTCTASPGASACPASSPRPASTTTASCCVRGPLLFDGYLDDPEATAAALERRLVPHRRRRRRRRRGIPLDRRPGGRRDPHRRRDRRAARGRVRARDHTRRSPTSRWSACPTRSGARSSAR